MLSLVAAVPFFVADEEDLVLEARFFAGAGAADAVAAVLFFAAVFRAAGFLTATLVGVSVSLMRSALSASPS